jgi:hypothetical protein
LIGQKFEWCVAQERRGRYIDEEIKYKQKSILILIKNARLESLAFLIEKREWTSLY